MSIPETLVTQTQPLDESQIRNNAGGYVYCVTPLTLFKRFLVLGSESGCYHATSAKLTLENAANVIAMINGSKGATMVDTLVEYSTSGRTAKQDSIIFALALLCKYGDERTKQKAYASIEQICRIPTTLFMLVEFLTKFADGTDRKAQPDQVTDCTNKDGSMQTAVSENKTQDRPVIIKEAKLKQKSKRVSPPNKGKNWGRRQRRAIANWYNLKNPYNLDKANNEFIARLMTKYKNRNNWTHKDLLLCAHVKPSTTIRSLIYKYSVKGWSEMNTQLSAETDGQNVYAYLKAIEEVKTTEDVQRVVELVQQHKLEREHLPTNLFKHKEIWVALLNTMEMTAIMRNLGKMTSIELLKPLSEHVNHVVQMFENEENIRKAKLHPFNVLVALNTYASGSGHLGDLKWTPVPQITEALESCYYKSFHNVKPTNKRFLIGVDVSSSMSCGRVLGSKTITASVAAAAMAMVAMRTESQVHVVGFSEELILIPISKKDSLEHVIKTIQEIPMGGTDCAQPMLYAIKEKLQVDVFIVYTDNETFWGEVHPAVALRQYREMSGIDAKLIVVGFQAISGTIADPKDAGMMDMEGFDSAAPEVMRNFILGEI